MGHGSYQISERILIGVCAPPMIAGIFWLMALGWIATMEPGETTTLAKQRLQLEFRIVLALLYLLVFGETVYSFLI